uniref:Glypican-3 alpha subunit n=1 Tax=Macrostomum lignano TaxID=282301 RepID=A0A1I8GT19_9PLAT
MFELQRLQLQLIEASRPGRLRPVRGDPASGPVAGVASDLFDAIAVRVFALTMNNYELDRRYLDCAAKRQFGALRPLGSTPDQVGAELLKAFVAGRRFLLGLASLAETLRGVTSGHGVQLSADCLRARMRAHYCAWCDGVATANPCYNLCANVARLPGRPVTAGGALRPAAGPSWREWAGLVDGASSMRMRRNHGDAGAQGPAAGTDHRRLRDSASETGAMIGASSATGAGGPTDARTVESPADDSSRQARLTELVGQVRAELRALRGFFNWEQLVVQKDCQAEPRPDACWNGTALPAVQARAPAAPTWWPQPEVSVPESALSRPAEPVATRQAELRTAIELATSLPRGGVGYRSTGRPPIGSGRSLGSCDAAWRLRGVLRLAGPAALELDVCRRRFDTACPRRCLGQRRGSAPPASSSSPGAAGWRAGGCRYDGAGAVYARPNSAAAPTLERWTPWPQPPAPSSSRPTGGVGSGDHPPSLRPQRRQRQRDNHHQINHDQQLGPIDTGGSGVGQPDEEPDDRLGSTRGRRCRRNSRSQRGSRLDPSAPATKSRAACPPDAAGVAASSTARRRAGWPRVAAAPDAGHLAACPAVAWSLRCRLSSRRSSRSGPPQVPEFPPLTQRPPQWPTRRPQLPTQPPPQQPQLPDLWLPKEPDEQGGAEGRRGEGSVHTSPCGCGAPSGSPQPMPAAAHPLHC